MEPDNRSLHDDWHLLPEAAFDELAQLAAQVCQASVALISLDENNQHRLKSLLGTTVRDPQGYLAFCDYARQQSGLVMVQDAWTDRQFAANPLVVGEPYLRFYAGLPLVTATGQVVGSLGVMDRLPRSLTLEQYAGLQVLARQVVWQWQHHQKISASPAPPSKVNPLAIAAAADPVPSADSLHQLNAAIGKILVEGGGLSAVLKRCAEAMVQHLEAAFVRFWTFNPDAMLLELQAAAGSHGPTEEFPDRIPLGISIVGFIAQTQQPYLAQDVVHDLCIGDKAWLQREQMVEFAGYPLRVEDRLVAVMVLFSHRPLSGAARETLGWLSQMIAIAIDRLWAKNALLSRREAILFRLASQIRDSLNLDIILRTTVTEIRTLLNIDRCHFLWCWRDESQLDLVITHEACHSGLPSLLGDCPTEYVPVLAAKILNLRMLRLMDITSEAAAEPEIAALLSQLNIAAQLMLPLETRSNQLGAIVCSHSQPRVWSDSEVELLQAVVDQVVIAIDQADLYAKTRAAALEAETQARQLSEALHHLQQTQAQLIQTEKMSSLGQMVAGIAHEINNPVNFINGNLVYANHYTRDLLQLVQLYRQHYPTPAKEIQALAEAIDVEFISRDLPKLLTSMRVGGDRIREIVQSLRNFSRLDEAEMKPVDIHEGIDSTLLILHNRLKVGVGGLEVQIIKNYGELPFVECYPGQLNQVFMNVLSNAIDALEAKADAFSVAERPCITIQTEFNPGSAHALVAATEPAVAPSSIAALPSEATQSQVAAPPGAFEAAPAGMITIRIHDNGAGMTPTTREKLFDPFFTTKPIGKGTGLGMSISYQIVVQKHGGSLTCASEPHQGTEFVIQIPSCQHNAGRHHAGQHNGA